MSPAEKALRFPGGWWWLTLPLLASAWVRDLWAPDEPRYAEVAREIYESGSFLVLHLCGDLYPDKPPLLYWLAGFFGWLSSWSDFAMRMPSIIATVAAAWLTARIARRWWGEVEATWSAAIFLTTFMVIKMGGRLQIDPLLAVLCLLALDLMSRPEADPRRRARLLVLGGLMLGFGGLAKGPVAYLNVGLVLLAWSLARVGEGGARVSWRVWLLVVAAAILPVLAWALAAAATEPRLFEALFYDQHIGRVTKADRHPGPIYKHLLRLPYLLLPWTLLVAAELVRACRSFRARLRDGVDRGVIRAGLWLAVIVLFYSLIPPKRDLYLLSAYPAAALLAARGLARAMANGRLARWISMTTPAILGVVGLAVAAVGFVIPERLPGLEWRAPLLALPLVVGAAVALVFARRDPRRWAVSVAVSFCLFATMLALLVFSAMNPLKSGRGLAAELAARSERPQEIPCIGVQPEAYRFYGRVPTVRAEEFGSHLERDGENFLAMVLVKEWRKMPPEEQADYLVLDERQVGSKEIMVLGAAVSSDPDLDP